MLGNILVIGSTYPHNSYCVVIGKHYPRYRIGVGNTIPVTGHMIVVVTLREGKAMEMVHPRSS